MHVLLALLLLLLATRPGHTNRACIVCLAAAVGAAADAADIRFHPFRFMKSHTVGHQSILDPTGCLPVYPSQATLVKDWSFGLGTGSASAQLIAKYHQLNPEVEPNQTLLPRKLRYLLHLLYL